ncbi:phage integrase SAM-like domain-containing protein [Gillisia limnaea]|uniref:Integrase family protein n=1 Tax=Gillisia limnaea (strain DSM 15749 / LMG 21470 / R-8282) TaxID=865937 RepID=H2BVB2_GILLR|nr:phage integrase SAM-like domain-containing protein [Gillisia limnaea]EHQ01777.1 integrase family protein [Gillisia limnaea DSM 15749]
MATVNFRIRSKANRPVSIFIYVSLEVGNVISTPSGFNVLPKDWSTTTKRPKQNSEGNKKTFSELNKLQKFIYDEVNTAQSKGQLIDVHWLKDKIDLCFDRVNKTDHSLLINHTQYIIDNANTRKITGSNKIGISQRRVTGYKSFKKVMEVYEKETKKKIQLQDINKPFVDKFTNWLMNKKNYSTNYAGKILDNLKTVCLDAEKLDIKVNPYAKQITGFREQNNDRFIITLSFEELEQIRTAEIESEALKNARNWLLLGCEIGQRASDLLKLSPDNLRYKGNRIYFDIEQQKTGKFVTVGVIAPHVIDIVENNFPYPISQQKLNKHIKDVCELAKIEEMVKGSKYDKKTGRKKLDVYPKYDLITSHTFRRSFATNYYKKIPTAVLIGITGHSKESLFLEYINRREDKDLNADLFMKFYETLHQDKEPQLKVIRNASNQ